jgi:2-dehydro-3-deoxyphosphogluconate aldolase/(4S)-4-hydroxy-2-oxoglutarate aldolase
VLKEIESTGVVAVIRMKEPAKLRSVVDAMIAGGVRALEVTMTVPGAVGLIETLARDLPEEFQLGAGTVLDPETARHVILAGASFIVAPALNLKTIEMAHRYDVAVLPGCFSPTEILTAWEAGADVIKVFPATALGPTFFKDMRGPFPQIPLMPTGGVTPARHQSDRRQQLPQDYGQRADAGRSGAGRARELKSNGATGCRLRATGLVKNPRPSFGPVVRSQ